MVQLYLRCPFDRGPLWSDRPATAWLLVAGGIVGRWIMPDNAQIGQPCSIVPGHSTVTVTHGEEKAYRFPAWRRKVG